MMDNLVSAAKHLGANPDAGQTQEAFAFCASYDILKEVPYPWPIAEIVYQHHERMDGTGYPRRLAGEEVLLEARILAAANTVEAMSARRPHRPMLGLYAALFEIQKGRGAGYDADVVDACVHILQEKNPAMTP